MDPRSPAQPQQASFRDSDPRDSLHGRSGNPFLQPAAPGSAFVAPQTWQQPQQQQQPQAMYPYVPQGVTDAVPNQNRDTSGSPVSRTSSGIPANRGAASYPVVSPAGLDRAPQEKKLQPPLFPDVYHNKDAAGPVLNAPPVAVQEPARPGMSKQHSCMPFLCLHERDILPTTQVLVFSTKSQAVPATSMYQCAPLALRCQTSTICSK
jgi:hypothetical protein